jgi:hypothetical protein
MPSQIISNNDNNDNSTKKQLSFKQKKPLGKSYLSRCRLRILSWRFNRQTVVGFGSWVLQGLHFLYSISHLSLVILFLIPLSTSTVEVKVSKFSCYSVFFVFRIRTAFPTQPNLT